MGTLGLVVHSGRGRVKKSSSDECQWTASGECRLALGRWKYRSLQATRGKRERKGTHAQLWLLLLCLYDLTVEFNTYVQVQVQVHVLLLLPLVSCTNNIANALHTPSKESHHGPLHASPPTKCCSRATKVSGCSIPAASAYSGGQPSRTTRSGPSFYG